MKLQAIHVGDVVNVDGKPAPYRVIEKNHKTGILTLEALHKMNRVVWCGVHEFRVEKRGAFV